MRDPVDAASCRRTDLACGRSGWLLWGVPWVLIGIGAIWQSLLFWLWIPAFLVAGAACVHNARRCGRVHCYVTGPLFLLAAAYLALAAAGLAPLSVSWLLGVVFGVALAAFLAERKLGRYRTA